MTSCDKDQLDELLKKGQAVTATLNRIDDINQMDGLIKKGQTDAAKLSQDYCRTELDELLKQGQTIIQNLSHDGPKVRLDEVLNQSRELIEQLTQNDHMVHPVSAKKNARKSTYKVRSRKRDKPIFVNKSRQIPKPSISTHHDLEANKSKTKPTVQQGFRQQDHETLLHELQDMLSSAGDNFHSENTSASLDWGTRAAYSSEKWKEARPSLISNMLATEHIIPHICQKCKANEAVFKCRECLPMQYICMECDIVVHSTHVFHNRSSMIAGFHMAVAPTTVMKQDPDGRYFNHHDSRLLPMALPVSICQCGEKKYSVGKGRSITVINMKGRYDLSIPRLYCERCQENWVPGLREVQDTGYWPGTINFSTLYDFEVFQSFEDLKMAAPGLSRLAFIRMLDMKTAHYGRSGNLCGDAFYKSFLEWSICRYEVDKICGAQHFKCTACTPLMLAVAVDGNRKLHRFKKAGNSKESGYFDGVFLCKDEDVSSFVDDIRKKVPHAPGKGVCGSAEFAAAKESSRKSSSRLDEEGIEVAVCRHGVLLRALNMFRGEIYAYPLYLQKELCTENVTFFCADIMCKYWPYLIKVCRVCPELRNLLDQKPFLSVMHAKVHGIKCEIKWSGSYQTGAAYTMGEEVEQANSFLSRIAISTKFMSKAGRTHMLTLQCIGWNKIKVQNMCKTICTRHRKTQQNLKKEKESLEDMKSQLAVDNEVIKQWVTEVQEWAHTATSGDNDVPVEPLMNTIEEMAVSIKQRRHHLYRHTATNKGRNKIRRKINLEKKKLATAIEQHNALVDPLLKIVSIEDVLETDYVFPWQVSRQDSVNLLTKKKVFDKVMLIQRLEEEQVILVQEAKQHWLSMQSRQDKMTSLLDTINAGGNPWNLSEEGIQGLHCMLQRRLDQLTAHRDTLKKSYQMIDNMTTCSTVEDEYVSCLEDHLSSSTDQSSDEDDTSVY